MRGQSGTAGLFDGAVELIPTAMGVFSNASGTTTLAFDEASPRRLTMTDAKRRMDVPAGWHATFTRMPAAM